MTQKRSHCAALIQKSTRKRHIVHIEEHIKERKVRLGRNLSVSYRRPISMARGYMQYMIDDLGQRYLDIYNNVPHVGHNHPHVVKAAQEQFVKWIWKWN